MSAGYAERLKEYPNKGICGLPENYDSARALNSKLDKLSQLIQQSRYTVVLTGAGISTSAGIPDFRGPTGIWTKEKKERDRTKKKKKKEKTSSGTSNIPREKSCEQLNSQLSPVNGQPNDIGRKRKQSEINGSRECQATKKIISFEAAVPTYAHRALTHLVLYPPPITKHPSSSIEGVVDGENGDGRSVAPRRKYLHHIVTQNVDGLHRKTGLPRESMSVLHGCIFTEACDMCGTEHVRDLEVRSIGLKHTGGSCTLGGSPPGSCPGRLRDTLLDWEDDLPEIDWARAQEECYKADLVLCLGTSLRIEPAASLCTYPAWSEASSAKNKRGKRQNIKGGKLGYAVVNLQQTPYDDEAALVVRGKVDEVMKSLMVKLGYGSDWEAMYCTNEREVIVVD